MTLERELEDVNDRKKDVFQEARETGLDVPTLKRMLQRRRKNRDRILEEDELLRRYEEHVEGHRDPFK